MSTITSRVLDIDPAQTTEAITTWIRRTVFEVLKKKGAVVGISGGVDSAVVTALCVRALSPEHVFGLFTPERHSSEETLTLSRGVADRFGISGHLDDITPTLQSLGCYRLQEEAVRSVIPDFEPDWKFKIVLPSLLEGDFYRVFSVIARAPDGREERARLDPRAYLGILAATNFKQRTRKMLEYYHADRLNFAVAGTPNRLEFDQGFFVKGGDGQADFKPIAHLYKTQVYQLAEYLGVPEVVRSRPPTTDTYSMAQGQDEFYFSLPYDQMDLCLWAKNHGHPPESLTETLGLSTDQIERVFRDIDAKRRATRYQHLHPILVEPIVEVGGDH